MRARARTAMDRVGRRQGTWQNDAEHATPTSHAGAAPQVQTLAVQVSLVWVHATPQSPQFCASLVVSTQAPPHGVSPLGHPQEPAVQTWPPVQGAPAPQPHALAVQVSLVSLQTLSHAPQFCASRAVSTQTPWQPSPVGIGRQMQVWLMHMAPVEHLLPQPPQLAVSTSRSAHTPPQTSGTAPGQTQVPEVHAPPGAHALPQAPQLAMSTSRSPQPRPDTARA